MAKRSQKRYSDKDREKALAIYMETGSAQVVSERLNIPRTTIKTWIGKMSADEIAETRRKKREEFATRAWVPINKALTLLDRELDTALNKQDELDALYDIIMDIDKGELSDKRKLEIARKIERLQRMDLRELTTAIGTLYDKQALALGDSTSNQSITVELDKELEEYAG